MCTCIDVYMHANHWSNNLLRVILNSTVLAAILNTSCHAYSTVSVNKNMEQKAIMYILGANVPGETLHQRNFK